MKSLKTSGFDIPTFFVFVKDNPQLCWGNKESFSVANENKTPFDIIKMRLPTASNKSKGGHSK